MVVAAGIFIAAATLFLPALGQSRFAARVNGCRDNLRQIGIALNDYSTQHNGFFPNIPLEGSMAGAGSYAPRLVEYGFILNPYLVVCPASQWADPDANFYVPLPPELRNSRGAQLVRLQRMMGGSYGYSLGHVSDGHYSPPKNLGRRTFVLMADAPSGDLPHHSLNHGGSGQNALFEDMHVQFLNSCRPDGCRDHIYLNHHGLIAAGVDEDDSVVGASDSIPMLTPAANRSQ
jgi:hypothetical protein